MGRLYIAWNSISRMFDLQTFLVYVLNYKLLSKLQDHNFSNSIYAAVSDWEAPNPEIHILHFLQ